jgi:hypothetical protein
MMGHHQTQIDSISPRVLEMAIIEIWRQHVGIEVIQSPNVIITTIWMEMVVTPNTNVVRSGVLIGSTINLGCGSGGVLVRRNLSQSSRPNNKY